MCRTNCSRYITNGASIERLRGRGTSFFPVKHEKLPPSYIQDAKNFSVVKPLNSGEARASPASPVPRPLLCSISKFFHNSKICNSC